MAAPVPATSTSSDVPATAEGPVLSVLTKRLRALRKKHNRILQMEDSLSQGKTLNKEQQEVLRSKPSVVTLIDELEKLRSPLAAAVDEEISLAKSNTSSSSPPPSEEPAREERKERSDDDGEVVKDLLNLIYFGSLFDVKQQSEFTSLMLTRTHERGCCLTYDYVTDDSTDDLLVERDLDLISALQGLMISRPVNSPVSHRNALESCIHHAKLWLSNSDQFIDPQFNVTYAGLREKLKKIMASDYFTATPQMKGPGEVAAAAAGVGTFGSFQVSMHETMVPVEVPVQIEGSAEQYPDTEGHVANYEEYEAGEHHSGSAEEPQDDVETENPSAAVQTEQEQLQVEEDQGYLNSDFKEQQYIPRRGSRGGRGGGGGRRGYSNGRGGRGSGRGGGPYQNGRSHQYYDNYHQPRNYYNRRGGRGGGGGNGGGNSYYNHSSATQGNHTQANMGVAS